MSLGRERASQGRGSTYLSSSLPTIRKSVGLSANTGARCSRSLLSIFPGGLGDHTGAIKSRGPTNPSELEATPKGGPKLSPTPIRLLLSYKYRPSRGREIRSIRSSLSFRMPLSVSQSLKILELHPERLGVHERDPGALESKMLKPKRNGRPELVGQSCIIPSYCPRYAPHDQGFRIIWLTSCHYHVVSHNARCFSH